QIPAGLKYEIKSASNESVVSITKKLLLCTTPSFEALTKIFCYLFRFLFCFYGRFTKNCSVAWKISDLERQYGR
ncbi:hypothetical protein ACTNES_17725, partial [Blautia sp. HCP3S3_D9]|uniref:hypothetical protein n=1 Tax=Blautia sp. HCP3S3_D9 TaxID=3438912 RepID=UPI003F8989A9